LVLEESSVLFSDPNDFVNLIPKIPHFH